jgi:hypothetical protein
VSRTALRRGQLGSPLENVSPTRKNCPTMPVSIRGSPRSSGTRPARGCDGCDGCYGVSPEELGRCTASCAQADIRPWKYPANIRRW